MKITKEQKGSAMVVTLEGVLDTITAPELDQELRASMPDLTDLTLDFSGLEYITSAGLRVLLAAQKVMDGRGTMKVVNINESIRDVFDATGFLDILTVE